MTVSCGCPTDARPVAGVEYKGQGSMQTIPGIEPGMDAYVTGNGEKCIVVIYDIFGMHTNTRQLSDMLASRGYTVVAPDFFRKEPWPESSWPLTEETRPQLMTLVTPVIQNAGGQILQVVEWMKATRGCTKFATVGLCLGGKIISLMNMNKSQPDFICHTSAHPSFCGYEEGQGVVLPVMYLQTKEDDLTEFVKGLNDNKSAARCDIVDFKDQSHGFLSARGEPMLWKSDERAVRVREAISMIDEFVVSQM